jgi:pyruvate dehydrogenase E1 component alpha subunit
MGKVTGCSKGMGGSMHLVSPAHGFMGSVPIVAGTIPVAVGAGLAAKMDGEGNVAVSYFGDGSTEEGGFHESLNLAAIYKLPVIFVCENNLYSSHLDIQLRQPSDSISRFAKAQSIPYRVVDGNDVVSVKHAAAELIDLARAGKGPVFLEAVTYRWLGHVGPHENIDVGVRRSQKDIDAWKKRDPIKRIVDAMIACEMITKEEIDIMQAGIKSDIERAVSQAEEAPYPDESQLEDTVYAKY